MSIKTETEKLTNYLIQRDGICEPDAFLAIVANPNHPLHNQFEWDDTVAAQKYRRDQVSKLIVKVRLTPDASSAPVFVNVGISRTDGTKSRGYLPTENARHDPELWQQVMTDARIQVRGWRNRLAAFDQLTTTVDHLDKAIKEMNNIEGPGEGE